MNCEELQNIIFELANGELDDEARVSAEEHIANCDSCLSEVMRIKKTLNLINEQKQLKVPENFTENIMTALSESKPVIQFTSWLSYAATVALLVTSILSGIFLGDNIYTAELQQQDDGNLWQEEFYLQQSTDITDVFNIAEN